MTLLSFDILGRVTGHKQTTDGQQYTTGYSYNLAGALIEETYPSGRVVKNVLDNSGDLLIVESRKNASSGFWHYADAFTYNAAGTVTAMQLGNGRWESTTFNSRLQPTQIALGTTPGTTDKLKLEYGYGTTANNGNVLSQTITVPGLTHSFVQTYTYDSLNRLDDANETYNGTQTWRQDFTFDRYGNRNFNETNTTTIPKNCGGAVCTADRYIYNPGINSANNNRMNSGQGYTYDAAGNTLTDANGQSYIYDGENKQTKASNGGGTLGEYRYDGDGKRVKKIVPATGEVTVFVYDAAGKLIAEYSTIVESAEDAKVAYLTADHLGSPRINTDRDGKVTARHDYHPYGEEIITAQRTSHAEYTPDSVRKQFTGYERDGESGLDYAGARFFAKTHGRFTSTDPILIKKDRIVDPQRLNLYVYVRNNPHKFVDVTGEDLILANAVAQQQARANIDKNLTAAERANVAIQGNKVVLVNPTAIDPAKASEGYKLFYEYINPNAKLNATYYGIQAGQTVTTASGSTFTFQQVADSADLTVHVTSTDIEVVVAVGANVAAADNSTPAQPIAFPEHLILAHGLAHGSCGDSGMCAVHRENQLRQEQQLPLRSTTVGHTNFDAAGKNITIPFYPPSTVNTSGGPDQPIPVTPGVIQTNITLRPLEPLKKPD